MSNNVCFLPDGHRYDDTSDGTVSATVTLDGHKFQSKYNAWVLIGPPKYAPHQFAPSSLYDVMLSVAVESGWVKPVENIEYYR